MIPRSLIYFACCWLAALGAGAVGPQPVAVLDFQVPSEGGHQWDWAGGGLADLLQIEFEQLGLVTLDRDYIHAVLAEQRLGEPEACSLQTMTRDPQKQP